ncbi:MAG: hypothetical protein OEZ01_12150, partial [Candidatus Heimdallarchaeota archaeon]|nr:hypothetical protein [Candidatus Heimdallarchaeota archaeon]
RVQLEIKEYIDHKIFGFSRLPGKSPMSTTREVRAENPQLIDFFIKYFHVSINTKNSIWMMLDKSDESYCYIQFVDALSLRKIFFAKVKIMQKGKKT